MAASGLPVAAQPNWELNPHDYEYSMTVTGKITTDGHFAGDENDVIAAFVDDECRGFTSVKYEDFMGEYFVYLMIYSNDPAGDITFKIFDNSENLVVSTKDTITFGINRIVGSLDDPHIFSSHLLTGIANLSQFTVPNQYGETIYNGNTFYLTLNSAGNPANLIAGFDVPEGSKVYVAGVEQVSGITENDFTGLLKYIVISPDFSDTAEFIVSVAYKMNEPPSELNLSNNVISESAEINSVVARINVVDSDLGDSHEFSLIEGDGNNDAENGLFGINGSNLIITGNLNFGNKPNIHILIRATDSDGATYDQPFELEVTNSNDPPRFESTPVNFVLQDEIYVYAIEVNDVDGDQVELNFDNLPVWLTFNPNSNLISGMAGNKDVGDYNFTIKASDGEIESVQNVVITVINKNDPPEIRLYIDDQFFVANRENEIHLPANSIIDPDNEDTLNFSLSTENNSALPGWLMFNSETMMVSGIPPKGTVENIYLKLTATDKGNLKEWIVFKLIVSVPTAVEVVGNNHLFNCYPNPFSDKLILNTLVGYQKAEIKLISSDGKVLKNLSVEAGGLHEMDFGNIRSGIYFLQMRQGIHQQTEKLIKE